MASRKEIQALITLAGKIDPSLQKAMKAAQDQTKKTTSVLSKMGKGIGKSVKSVASSIGKVVAPLTAIASAAGFAKISMDAINAAAGMEQYRNTLNVVMKDQKKAAEIMGWAVDYSNITPFDTDEVVDATVKLQSYGLEAQKVLPLIGDMAGVMDKDLDQAVYAIAAAQTGELKSLKQFGITKEMIVQQANKKMRGIQVVNNKGQITDQKAFNLALFSLMKDRYEGGMELQSKTWKGLTSTIRGMWQISLSKIAGISREGEILAGGLFDRAKDQLQRVADYIVKLQDSGVFEKIGEKIGDIASKTILFFEKAIPKVIEISKKVTPAVVGMLRTLKTVFDFVVNNWSWIGPTILGIATTFGVLYTKVILIPKAIKGINDAITGIKTAMALLTSPIGLVALAIGALIVGGILLYKNWDKVSKFIVGIWQDYIMPFFSGIGEWFSGIWNGVVGAFQAAWSGITDWFSGLWEGIVSVFRGYINIYVKIFNFVIGALNKIQFKVPDWVPIPSLRGKQIGINIPMIPEFAKGGFTNQPSIFGEAGLEAAIPIKYKNPRSLSLLNQTAKMIGASPAGTVPSMSFNFNFHGPVSNKEDVINGVKQSESYIKRIVDDYFDEKARVAFG